MKRHCSRGFAAHVFALGVAGLLGGVAVPCQSQTAPSPLPQTGYPRWVATGDMQDLPHSGQTATLLADGKVFVVGGYSEVLGYSPTAEVYDPATGEWTVVSRSSVQRDGHTATLLADGRVLVLGGDNPPRVTQLWDPVTSEWIRAASPKWERYCCHTATLLPSGKVLVIGGRSDVAEAELYDPVSDTWTSAGNPARHRPFEHQATLLPDGRVLLTGGRDGDAESIPQLEIYDPVAGSWRIAGSLVYGRASHAATLLPNGKVLVSGGFRSGPQWTGIPEWTVEVFEPATGESVLTGEMNDRRDGHNPTLLANGKVLVTSLATSVADTPTAELYDYTTGKWTYTANPIYRRASSTATALRNGKVLLTGRIWRTTGPFTLTSELYEPFADASFRITALFSDQAGLYQMIQLSELSGLNGQRLTGLNLVSSSRGGVVKRFTFPNDPPATDTAFRPVLVKTASLSLPANYYDYVVPDGFMPTEPGGFVAIEDPERPTQWLSYMPVNGLPADGHSALRIGGVETYGLFQAFNSPVFHVTTGVDPVVEYYNEKLDHYFVSSSQPDLDALDSGRIPGWERTGYSFPAWISTYVDPLLGTGQRPPPRLVPVCRIYIPPSLGDSHFYSASAAECALSLAQHPQLTLETPSAFFATLPDAAGTCPSGQVPVYRLWNGRPDSNHRYTTSTDVRNMMIARGYQAEGDGPVLCAGGND